MSTFNSLMSSDEDPEIGDSSMHLFLESSQTSEVHEQGRSLSPAQIWRPHFESPVIANSPVTKLINRRRTLKERKIDPKEEKRFIKALKIETMSSEDSDSEDDSIFVTRPLPWVSTEFKQLIQRLDRKYDRTLNAQGKRLKSKRTVGEPSDKPCPKKPKGLEWMFDEGDMEF
ncbi:unnamed protein product [Mytilus coruscus]|uniref:Uncharacterized protein n=1 Tax=Mytilus coruscus TaxID=42192 RepID=A0A6J8C3R1_MYTCO|nr:unnamed protein product [Mytilus coruscus]